MQEQKVKQKEGLGCAHHVHRAAGVPAHTAWGCISCSSPGCVGWGLSSAQVRASPSPWELTLLSEHRSYLLHKPGNWIQTASRCLLMWDWINSSSLWWFLYFSPWYPYRIRYMSTEQSLILLHGNCERTWDFHANCRAGNLNFFFCSSSQADMQTWKRPPEKAQMATIYKISDFKVYRTFTFTGKKYPMLIFIHNLSV